MGNFGSLLNTEGANTDGVYDPVDYLVLLINLHRSDFILPMNLFMEIFQFADIVPRIRIEKNTLLRSPSNYNAVYMSSTTIHSLTHFVPVSVNFLVESKDQGWSSYPEDHGKRNSNTWLEASLSEVSTTRYHLFTNIHAGQAFEYQEKRCDQQSDLVKDLIGLVDRREGFPLTIRMHARSCYPGWTISIRRAVIEIELSLIPDWEQTFLS